MAIGGAVYVNGKITPAAEAVVPVYDHGFLYGDGVYEVLRTYNGVLFLYEHHMRRLRRSAAHVHLDVPFDDVTLATWIEQTRAAAGLESRSERRGASSPHGASKPDGVQGTPPSNKEAYVRILLTRGVGETSYDIKATPTPSLVIMVKPLENPPARVDQEGIRISLVSILRNHPGSVNPIIKSNNLLNNALAMQEALGRGGEEALLCNYRGELAECSQSNFFMVRGGVAFTPRSEAGLLEGITRGFIFDVAEEVGIEVRRETLVPKDLETADEAFITSTTREISPVVRIDDRVIGMGKPGPITIKLLDSYRRRARAVSAASYTEA